MGANESKTGIGGRRKQYEDATRCFDAEELEKWKRCFTEITLESSTKRGGFINETNLSAFTNHVLVANLSKKLFSSFLYINRMSGSDGGRKKTHLEENIDLDVFIVCIAQLLKGGMEEKTRLFAGLCGSVEGTVNEAQIKETIKAIILSYSLAESHSSEFKTWHFPDKSPSQSPDEWTTAMVDYISRDIHFDENGTASLDSLIRWMGSHFVLSKMVEFVLYAAFRFDLKRNPEEISFIPWTIPICELVESKKFVTLLNAPDLIFLNYQIPSECRRGWRLLFATSIHGESFSTLLKQIKGRGATILIIEDENGFVFGGFNSKSWELSSNFLGDEQCFVFSLFPSLAIYNSTGYNKNYCYLNSNQQTLPNGLGFGGQINDSPTNYFSLWLEGDFGRGSSQGSCTTYNSPQLSSNHHFKIKSLEAWSVETVTDQQKEKMAKSVLDVDPGARAILEMIGKKQASEGLREPHPEDDE